MNVKRTWLVLFGLLLPASPAAVQAQFIYTTNNGAITLAGYTGAGGTVVIFNFVTSIGSNAFYGNTSLTSVTIPGSVTNIGDDAFYGCSSLTNVTIPNSVTSIGDVAFYDCSSLTSLTIPNELTSIGELTFFLCSNLTSVNIPDSVTSIGELALGECYRLTNVTIPNSVTNIEDQAFFACSNLASVTIPKSVTSIGSNAFENCGGLTNVYFQGNAPNADATVFAGDTIATAYYLFGATGWSNSFAGLPAVLLNPPGGIQVTLLPASANGQWRFPWEVSWRNSGTTASNLVAGTNYTVVFSTVPGYLTPTNSGPVPVTGGVTNFVTYQYSPATSSSNVNTVGLLTVNFVPNPPSGAAWGLAGASNQPSFPSGYSANLAAGTYLIDFAPVAGFATPANLSVLVVPGIPMVLSVTYVAALASNSLPANFRNLPVPVPSAQISDPPFGYNGQLQTDVGYGSGVAVQTNVVLTAADLVFNDQTLSYANQATWFLQQETNVSAPAPMQARGWFVLSGYAAQRTSDLQAGLAPGQSSPASRNFDVAALFFESSVAAGGSGGFLSSDATPNSWLTSAAEKMLVGYPVDGAQFGAANITNGEMYEILPQTNALSQATDDPSANEQVYLADWFLSFPGNNGGPLYVESNGFYYPAAVYLGTLYNGILPSASAVRAIDGDVTDLINMAAGAGSGGQQNNSGVTDLVNIAAAARNGGRTDLSGGGGGVIEIIPSLVSTTNPAFLQMQLQPAAAVQAGAGWRVHGATSYNGSDVANEVFTNSVLVEFEAVYGYFPPASQSFTVVPGQVSTFIAFYTNNPSEPVTNMGLTLLTNGVGKITSRDGATNRALLNTNKLYTITASVPPGSNWLFANWSGGTSIGNLASLSTNAALSFFFSHNLILEATFVANPFPAVAGVYNGLFMAASGVTQQTAGMLKELTIGQKGTYSGTLFINGGNFALSGAFDLAGQATNHISRATSQGSHLTVVLTLLNLNNSPPQVTGTVSGTNNDDVPWVAALTADRATNSPSLPSTQYTMLILPDTNSAPATSPGGAGYALITNYAGTQKNPAAATAKITGALADGTPFSQTVPVSQKGNIPIYANLYAGKGLLLGWINLDPASDPGASLVWVHPPISSGLVEAGFTSTNLIALSPWTNPPASSVLAYLTNLTTLDLFYDTNTKISDYDITISGKFKIGQTSGSTNVSGSLAPKTGLLTVTIGSGSNEVKGYGAILLNATNAGGYGLSKTKAEAIHLGP